MKILLYGSCGYPFFFREMILRAAEKRTPIQWNILLLSWRHQALFEGVLPPENIYYVPEHINRRMKEPMPDLACLGAYAGSIFKDIAVDKNLPGMLRRKSKDYQLKNTVAYYQVYKDYLIKEKPDAIFLPITESHDGIVLFSTAKELGIPTLFPTSSRSLRICFFSKTPNEDLPAYAFTEAIRPEIQEQAAEWVKNYEKNPVPSFGYAYTPTPEEVISFNKLRPVSQKLQRLPIWLWNLFKDFIREPHVSRPNPLWFQPIAQFWWLTLRVSYVKSLWRKRYFDISETRQLPPRFIYFPLHVDPELSVLTLAPYFEDTLRAIDLLLFNMPSDHYLVVKEHPVMRGRRRPPFYKALLRRPGVILASHDMPSLETIKRASLTVTITGTAALEALLLGRPSLMLGKTFFSSWLPSLESLDQFADTLRAAMAQSPESLRKKAVDCVAHVLQGGYNFAFNDPHGVEYDSKFTMNLRNLDAFLEALQDHFKRLSAVKK